MKKKIAWALLIVLVVIQFIRPARNEGSAASANDITHATTVSPEVKNSLETSCYDCHSNHTVYPWYTNLQPVGWWMSSHVNDGKRGLNFSAFAAYGISKQMRKYDQIAEQLEEGEMPLDSYLWIHHNAKLNEAQKKLITDWAHENKNKLALQYPDSIPKKH